MRGDEFRDEMQSLQLAPEYEGVKVTLLAFVMKACAIALTKYPKFSSSLASDGQHIIIKEYITVFIFILFMC